MEPSFCFDDAVFTYAVAPRPIERFSQHTPILNGALTISYTSKTELLTEKKGAKEIAIIGFCVDAHGEVARSDIPAFVLSQEFPDMESAFRFFDRFAGKYVVLFQDGENRSMWGDATNSLQINYGRLGSGFCAAATDKLAARKRRNRFPGRN